MKIEYMEVSGYEWEDWPAEDGEWILDPEHKIARYVTELEERVKSLEEEIDEFAKVDADDKMYIAEVEAQYQRRIRELEAENERFREWRKLTCPACGSSLGLLHPDECPLCKARDRVKGLEAENKEMKCLLQKAERKMDFQAKQALKETENGPN